MRIVVDTERQAVITEEGNRQTVVPLYSNEAFRIISKQWVKIGWNQQYAYSFTWMGRPIIQLPEDLVRIQEIVFSTRPDVIIETGVAHGGSLVFYATLCRALGGGRVIGVDLEIRQHNRRAIESHQLADLISLVQGDSVAEPTLKEVKSLLRSGESVLVILDSCHTREHVAKELDSYHSFVTPGSYLVVTDGIMASLCDVPRGDRDWSWDNPAAAARQFVSRNPDFRMEEPEFLFNEGTITERVTYWPSAFLRRAESQECGRD